MKIIFLDIDGVLNGYGRGFEIVYRICSFLHLRKLILDNYELFDVKARYVKRLAKIVRATDAKIVLSSSWRRGYLSPYEKKTSRQKSLVDQFAKYSYLDIIGITPKDKDNIREKEIKQWLKENGKDVSSFVIIDDETFDLKSLLEFTVVTSATGKVTGAWTDKTGLKKHHIPKAIDILNSQSTMQRMLIKQLQKEDI